jgi:hypothetical protein
VVPTFQRGYSWEKKHVEAFWRDVRTFQTESGVVNGPDRYFLGPIVILPISKEEIHLLDGQQRLATATILCSVLRDAARSLQTQGGNDLARDIQVQTILKEDGGPFSLQLGEMDDGFFRNTIQSDPPVEKDPTIRSHRRIRDAHGVLRDAVRASTNGQSVTQAVSTIKKLWQTLRSDLVMACIPVASERDAFRIFETLNDRGLRLSVPDLLLNYLMRVANPESTRGQIRRLWDEMLVEMGRRDINKFLRHMWVSKYGDLKSQHLFSALKEHIEEKGLNSLDFTRACSEECDRYVQLLDGDEALKEAKPFVNTLLRDLDVKSSLPLLLSSYFHFDSSDFKRVVQWILVFVMRYSIIANQDPAGMETLFYGLARDIRIKLLADPPIEKSKCLANIKETLVKSAPTKESVQSGATTLMLSPETAKYVLSKVATRMQSDTKEVAIDEANLEHIFPKNPEEGEWGGKANQELLEPYLWHIGNLTVLGKRLNRKAANKEFQNKRDLHYRSSEIEMTQRLAKSYDLWNEDSIKDRAKKLSEYVTEIWNFDNPSRL